MLEALACLALIPFALFGLAFCCGLLKAWWPTLKVLAVIGGSVMLLVAAPLVVIAALMAALG